jgi:N-acetylmuramoyl-L-alanine amidase
MASFALTMAAAQPTPTPECASAVKVVLDAGHTPEQPGARSARGKSEFDFNLKLADLAAQELERLGYAVSVPVIHGIGQQQLSSRIAKARSYSPALFLSLHHDSVQRVFLHEWSFGGRANYYSDEFSGFSIFLSKLSAKFEASLAIAQVLADELIRQGLQPSLHHAMKIPGEGKTLLDPQRGIYLNNQLVVLKETLYPALLLEAGIIVNRADEVSLQAENIQARIAQAIAQTVTQSFCRTNVGITVPPAR